MGRRVHQLAGAGVEVKQVAVGEQGLDRLLAGFDLLDDSATRDSSGLFALQAAGHAGGAIFELVAFKGKVDVAVNDNLQVVGAGSLERDASNVHRMVAALQVDRPLNVLLVSILGGIRASCPPGRGGVRHSQGKASKTILVFVVSPSS